MSPPTIPRVVGGLGAPRSYGLFLGITRLADG